MSDVTIKKISGSIYAAHTASGTFRLDIRDGHSTCSCAMFREYGECAHTDALEELTGVTAAVYSEFSPQFISDSNIRSMLKYEKAHEKMVLTSLQEILNEV